MPDIKITDLIGQPVASIDIDLSTPSSLLKYLKSECLYLAVTPEILKLKELQLSQVAPKPLHFSVSAHREFDLGSAKREIAITPSGKATIRVNANPGSNLFDGDPFHNPAKVPESGAYVSTGFEGSLSAGVSGWEGALTFGFNDTHSISLEYAKAFPLQAGEPQLGRALGQTLSSFVIPADISDLEKLSVNDIATVSGEGILKVSGGWSISAIPNPLASVDLPLGAGTIALKTGAVAGLSASFTITGSYQVRARRLDAQTIELSFLQQSGTLLKVSLSGSAGVSAKVGDKELIAAVLGAISTDPVGDKKLLSDLQPAEMNALAAAIQSGLDHSLQTSVSAALSALTDDQAAFQYQIQPSQMGDEAISAVQMALKGDLSLLTALESDHSDGFLAPGLRMINSVFTETRKRSVSLKINLLGILNYLTVSELVRNSEVLTDEVTGSITIREIVKGQSITSIVEPLKRNEALRKAIFDSILVTTCYRAGNAVAFPALQCEQMHFVLNENSGSQIVADYLNWFVALHLLSEADKSSLMSGVPTGKVSTCVLRTLFGDTECSSMFFDQQGELHSLSFYREIGRRAMRALLSPRNTAIDALRYRIVDDPLWPQACETGPNVNLGTLVDLSTADARVQYLVGDVFVIRQWADAMVEAGRRVLDIRKVVRDADPATLFRDSQFKKKRDELQKTMAGIVKASKVRFDEPWGMVCLFWAAGSPANAQGRIASSGFTLEKKGQILLTAATA